MRLISDRAVAAAEASLERSHGRHVSRNISNDVALVQPIRSTALARQQFAG